MGGGGAAQESSQSSSPRSSPHPSSPTTATSSKSMTTISRHYFGRDSSDGSHDFFVDIIESMEEEYGMFVWPCSIILAEYVWQQRFRFSGATVAELGAGTSLPGLVAAKLGADVTLTDNSNRPEVLDNMKRICELNNLNCEILGITWGEWDSPMFDLHPQILLGADVFYDTIDFEDLFATVTFLLQRSPGSVFITAYHNRSGHHLIEFLMVKWRLKCVKLLDGFSIMPSIKASSLQGNIQLVEIILDGQ
ncbi:methyltransferase-like protein 23 isoform X2 [Asparagus officinalis]|uniref:methyltransferase-like protein 23 isoform X2 n=1 Tax=Asparagus officinalis TaxID=4686 RepID=UPI00098E7F84|nr:methyltransferase-like protein 23 isoform X2 [Asparagus officinalis]